MSATPVDIQYLSPRAATNMADEWFDIADLDHFWIKRRFEVLRTLLRGRDVSRMSVGEVGCGHGLVQRQFHDAYGVSVSGFDLNVHGLEASQAPAQPRYYYNVFDRHPSFRQHFDLIILFDVIEHIEDEDAFMAAVLHHLKPGGLVAVNVPAMQSLWSEYDRYVGHIRRYSVGSLTATAQRAGLRPELVTYWGLPMVPLLGLRTLRLALSPGRDRVVDIGFKPPSAAANRLLGTLASLEVIPQTIAGTSVMGLFA